MEYKIITGDSISVETTLNEWKKYYNICITSMAFSGDTIVVLLTRSKKR